MNPNYNPAPTQARHMEDAVNTADRVMIELSLIEQNEWLMQVRERILSMRRIRIEEHTSEITALENAITQIS